MKDSDARLIQFLLMAVIAAIMVQSVQIITTMDRIEKRLIKLKKP